MVSGGSFTDCKEHMCGAGVAVEDVCDDGLARGFALGPKPIIAAMSKLQSQSTSNTASMVQKASIAALTGSQECVAEMRADYIKLRDQVLAGFKTIPGLTCTVPQGAFYVYPNVSAFIGKGGIKSALGPGGEAAERGACGGGSGRGVWHEAEHIRLSYAVSAMWSMRA
jgi:aspartate aminotransferase